VDGGAVGERARRLRPRELVLALSWALLAVCLAACGKQEPVRRSLLLVTVDTLRADHLGCYGYPHETSPRIDALAARGVRFEDASVAWPKTWASVASLLTGTHPGTHGVRVVPRRVPDSLPLLAELLGEAGYATAAVVANVNVGRKLGFDRGFDRFVESWLEGWEREVGDMPYVNAPGRVKRFTNAEVVTDQALAWAASLEAGAPFFLWVHYIDPHGPYAPPPGFARPIADARRSIPPDRVPAYQLHRDRRGAPVFDLDDYVSRYDGEIRFLDRALGRLLDGIGARGAASDTLVILTSDHGESLGEHDYYLEHGLLPYQPSARVPLVVSAPGLVPAGRVVTRPVGLVDLAATIPELLGLPAASHHAGTSLVPLMRSGGEQGPAHVFMESGTHPARTQLSIRRGRWKLIEVRSAADRALMTGQAVELYDVAADPLETRDLAAAHPQLVAELRQALERWHLEASRARRETGAPVSPRSLDPRERQLLEELGYLESVPAAP